MQAFILLFLNFHMGNESRLVPFTGGKTIYKSHSTETIQYNLTPYKLKARNRKRIAGFLLCFVVFSLNDLLNNLYFKWCKGYAVI